MSTLLKDIITLQGYQDHHTVENVDGQMIANMLLDEMGIEPLNLIFDESHLTIYTDTRESAMAIIKRLVCSFIMVYDDNKDTYAIKAYYGGAKLPSF